MFSLAIPFIWMALYFFFSASGWWLPAALCVAALSFVTYGSTSHDLVHGNLGLRRGLNDVFLSITELICLRSGHAYRLAHLHHHASFPANYDIEGAAARMWLWRTLWEGIVLQPKTWLWALHRAGREKWIILAEVCACLIMLIVSAALWNRTPIFLIYCALVIMGSWIFPLMTVYLVHDVNGKGELFQTHAFRGHLASWIALEHLYHLEHHLYPSIPHHHWPKLARRLDPYFKRAGVKPRKILF
jgi:beta-carotene hydroxylase